MALQNRVGQGRVPFSFQFHFEKKVKLAQNAELQNFFFFFSEIARQLWVQIWLVG